ncbi:MAG: dephospho-CoA kinase [Rhodospirillales bacterium]|nr:MAG: dephospho-CoA kinase [Rhodospirillales bacterium]
MFILGLTGSIAMGKSTAAAMFRRLRVPVFDADREVHALLAPGGGAFASVSAAFPDALRDGCLDRSRIARRVFDDPEALAKLERILHPRVMRAQCRFLQTMARRRMRLVVLDIPLLFETGGERGCDAVAVVTAPEFIQRQRILARPGMDRARLSATLARQMADAEKRRRADFVIPTGLGKAETMRHIRRIVDRCSGMPGWQRPSYGMY